MTPTVDPVGPFSCLGALDLGQAQDYSALALARRGWVPGVRRPLPHFTVGYLKRWPLKTSYAIVVDDVADLMGRPPLVRPLLGVDQTGVGTAVVDMFRQANLSARLRPVLITGGHQTAKGDDGSWHVPKKELVSSLQSALQNRRLVIAAVPERETLIRELMAFKVKITTAGNESFEAWRERDHDDLVLAVAIMVWLGSRPSGGGGYAAGGDRPSLSPPGMDAFGGFGGGFGD